MQKSQIMKIDNLILLYSVGFGYKIYDQIDKYSVYDKC